MRSQSYAAEVIARCVHAERLRLAKEYKKLTPQSLRCLVYERTLLVYGNTTGPTVDFLRASGKSWDDIIDGASRVGVDPLFRNDELAETSHSPRVR
ncbi:hypothetical protein EV661_3223 [Variibacter gotjawalensis]|nr:hypothetical protein EV661_3223 [Variibacter gotjawalensis]